MALFSTERPERPYTATCLHKQANGETTEHSVGIYPTLNEARLALMHALTTPWGRPPGDMWMETGIIREWPGREVLRLRAFVRFDQLNAETERVNAEMDARLTAMLAEEDAEEAPPN